MNDKKNKIIEEILGNKGKVNEGNSRESRKGSKRGKIKVKGKGRDSNLRGKGNGKEKVKAKREGVNGKERNGKEKG